MSVWPEVQPGTPRFSIISAVYNVADYLDDFIASIEAQDYPLERVEVVMVDDGSTDGSPAILASWQRRRPGLVTLVTKENGGQGSARNAGIERARGEWITFPDPDDTLAPNYLSEVDNFLAAHQETEMVATNRILVLEATGERQPHPLKVHFDLPNRLRDLDEHPAFFHGSAPAAFFRNALIRSEKLRFDERIRPNFEDGHFCVSYLLRTPRPKVAFLRSAEYTYRKRANLSSTLNMSLVNPGRFTAVPEFGYLDVLRQAQSRRGVIPDWVQSLVLYELSWYFKSEDAGVEAPTAAIGEIGERFNSLLGQIAELLDPQVVQSFSLRDFKLAWREILLHSFRPEPWHSSFARVDKSDDKERLVRVSYRYVNEPPAETWLVDGVATEPTYQKTRAVNYFDRVALHERIVWLPFGAVRVKLDDLDVDVRLVEPQRPNHSLRLWLIREALEPRLIAKRRQRVRAEEKKKAISDRVLLRLSRTKMVRRLFADAWVLIDRPTDADDSAEHLFRYMRKQRRYVNAWFVIKRGTADYKRLRKDGYRRIVPYGSTLWKLLMLNCSQLISSHADIPIFRPKEITRISQPSWRFSFLQHGVIKDDLSKWLNPKDLDIFITSTVAEFESVVADGSPYRYTERETKLTGLPRFDLLLKAGGRYPPERRDLILVAPTWRNWLTVPEASTGHRVAIDAGSFAESEFGANWLGLIRSPRLEALAERHGCKVGVLLHPNLQALAPMLDVPRHVEMLSFNDHDVRETFARARVLVTDYSSMAFNAAYIERPVVYFQFDRDLMFGGGHVGRRGYFDYATLGYGPVADDLEQAVAAIEEAAAAGPEPAPEYLRRIREAFPQRDGRCNERVFKAIRDASRPITPTVETPPPTETAAADDAGTAADDEAVDQAIVATDDAIRPSVITEPAVVDREVVAGERDSR